MKAGTPLKGLNFVKGKEMPLAREDGEYPDWLWGLLEAGKFGVVAGKGAGSGGGAGGGGDLFSKSAKQRKLAARAARRSASSTSSTSSTDDLAPEIPIYEQSVDLPAVEEGWRGIHSPPSPLPLQSGEKAGAGGLGVGGKGVGGQGVVDGKTAREAREELTKSLRTQRRKGIKEANFLRGI
ncbi:MAG: hypothetical protein LQ350_008272, partial [Teloschistes chrysophthalmus]